ncbi:cellular tumor antigen p53 [Diachasma alloeum]|uniref:cellular tumor antigen p53 n=1 Tax=Diachasma alloeum TaxID=454923 RepID=UPI000738300B|nr:cellular tumor antigen p53 [Diachasma alloeum]
MATSALTLSSSQESVLYDEGVFNEIQKHVDIHNLPILEEEELVERKYDLTRQEQLVNNFPINPMGDIPYNHLSTQINMNIPIKEEFPGEYNFELLLNNQGAGKNCVFSQELRKVFINMEQTLPLKFKWDPPIDGLWLRTTMVFSMDQYRSDPVQRCHNHMATNSVSNQKIDERVLRHVVRCTHLDSIYEENSGHMSVSVPLGTPQPGCRYVPLGFQFFCKNSCSSGMNRRPTELVFTLETHQRQVLGRRILPVRVCSCPKRDKDKEEQESNDSITPMPGKKRKFNNLATQQFIQTHLPPGKKPLLSHLSSPNYDVREYDISIRVPGKDNASAILNYAFERLAGRAMRTGAHQHFAPYMDDIENKMNHIK